jgi:nicotinate-nucleotide--dimethylbenzimidazole phosphoribosyltransferase
MEDYLHSLRIEGPDDLVEARAHERWNQIAKPVGSLGELERLVERIAALTGDEYVDVSKRCVVVLCADNGVVAQGVSQSGADVTRLIAANAVRGISSINKMCEPINMDCVPVDMGMFEPLPLDGLRDCRIAAGTGDISLGPAMTREQALEAIRVGVELVVELADKGYHLIATGEMGIGNTTTSTAMTCAFVGADPMKLTGPGTGLSSEGVRHKAEVIRRALDVNMPDPSDPLDVLSKLGGFDIAAMCGLFLGGAVHRVPVVIDGFISAVAAYCAWRLRPECKGAMLSSHLSAEPGAAVLLERMGLSPVIHANMHLGEGTGAACLVPLLDMALNLYTTGPTLSDCGITTYKVDQS